MRPDRFGAADRALQTAQVWPAAARSFRLKSACPHIHPAFPRKQHGHLFAVAAVGFAQIAQQFAFLQQGADDEIHAEDEP